MNKWNKFKKWFKIQLITFIKWINNKFNLEISSLSWEKTIEINKYKVEMKYFRGSVFIDQRHLENHQIPYDELMYRFKREIAIKLSEELLDKGFIDFYTYDRKNYISNGKELVGELRVLPSKQHKI